MRVAAPHSAHRKHPENTCDRNSRLLRLLFPVCKIPGRHLPGGGDAINCLSYGGSTGCCLHKRGWAGETGAIGRTIAPSWSVTSDRETHEVLRPASIAVVPNTSATQRQLGWPVQRQLRRPVGGPGVSCRQREGGKQLFRRTRRPGIISPKSSRIKGDTQGREGRIPFVCRSPQRCPPGAMSSTSDFLIRGRFPAGFWLAFRNPEWHKFNSL